MAQSLNYPIHGLPSGRYKCLRHLAVPKTDPGTPSALALFVAKEFTAAGEELNAVSAPSVTSLMNLLEQTRHLLHLYTNRNR